MKSHETCIAFLAAGACMLLLSGCFESSNPTDVDGQEEVVHDPPMEDMPADPPADDWVCDREMLSVTGVAYNELAFPMTEIGVTIVYLDAVQAEVEQAQDGNLIDVTLTGYERFSCLCNDGMWCGPPGMSRNVANVTLGGLPAGDYILRINGVDYPLKVVGPECVEHTTAVTDVQYTESVSPYETPYLFHVSSSGQSCNCDGRANEAHRMDHTTKEIWIDLKEIICDPTQCCDTCGCVDSYETDVYIWEALGTGGNYTVHINGNDFALYGWIPYE